MFCMERIWFRVKLNLLIFAAVDDENDVEHNHHHQLVGGLPPPDTPDPQVTINSVNGVCYWN